MKVTNSVHQLNLPFLFLDSDEPRRLGSVGDFVKELEEVDCFLSQFLNSIVLEVKDGFGNRKKEAPRMADGSHTKLVKSRFKVVTYGEEHVDREIGL